MRKSIIILLMATLLPSVTFAQLKVNSSGAVRIGDGGSSGTLNIGQLDTSNYGIYLKSQKRAIKISNSSESVVSGAMGIELSNNFNSSGYNYGMVCSATNTNTSSGTACAIRATGTTGGTGCAYGVVGGVYNSTNGVGILGSSSSSTLLNISGLYAGYFNGNVKVTGTIDGTLVSSSDARLKEDVQGLDTDTRGKSVLDALESLTPVSFRYKQVEMPKNEPVVDENGEEIIKEKVPNPVMEKEHFGLIAQELQEVYPNLVYEKDDGYLAVNYVELVPVLMQAIKELKAKVESLETVRADRSPLLGGGSGGSDTASLNDSSLPLREETEESPYMNQNVPNPFTEKTDIAIYLPESVQTATLYIYDLSGKQLEQHSITGRGNTVMTIHADRMDAGMYVYSLIADKRVVMAKKMVVVK